MSSKTRRTISMLCRASGNQASPLQRHRQNHRSISRRRREALTRLARAPACEQSSASFPAIPRRARPVDDTSHPRKPADLQAIKERARADSNGRPLAPEASALSTELRALCLQISTFRYRRRLGGSGICVSLAHVGPISALNEGAKLSLLVLIATHEVSVHAQRERRVCVERAELARRRARGLRVRACARTRALAPLEGILREAAPAQESPAMCGVCTFRLPATRA